MGNLSEKNCDVCRADAPQLSDDQLQESLTQLPDWKLDVVEGVKQVAREYRFKNFAQALAFTQAVGALAEEYSHHPALLTEWGKVKVSWWTHKIHGVHENDVIMAAKTEQLFRAQFASS